MEQAINRVVYELFFLVVRTLYTLAINFHSHVITDYAINIRIQSYTVEVYIFNVVCYFTH